MSDGIFLLQEPTAVGAAEFSATVSAIVASIGSAFAEVETVEACVKAVEDAPGLARLVVIAPNWSKPLLAARRIAREREETRFAIVATSHKETALRREAIVGAPPGGRWAITSDEPAAMRRAIVEGLRAFGVQRRLRTTLERVNHDLRAAATLDPREYRRLVASDRYLASVLEAAHDAIISLDLTQSVVSWNRAAERLFGIDRHAASRIKLGALFAETTSCTVDLAAAFEGMLDTAEWPFRDSGGVERQFEATLDVVRDEKGATTGLVVILRDVTERHEAARAVRLASEQKDEFLAMLSHELRNPLAPIRTAAELMARLHEPESQSWRLAKIVQRQATHMTALVEDLLDVAGVGRGAVVLERQELVLGNALNDAIGQVSPLMESHGHHLMVEASGSEMLVSGDRRRLAQIFCHVLTNSAKYTPSGGEIRMDVKAELDDVVVVIEDKGLGIDEEVLSRVFDLFSQGHRTPDRSQGGLGVGLPIAKALTELHGGVIAVHSDGPGTGTRVEIRLPLLSTREPVAAAHPVAHTPLPMRLNVMVVDDNEDAARTLGLLLEAIGHVVDVEVDPREALRRATTLSPDVFILDIGMPYLDGYELARRLLAQREGDRPILIALTGYGQPGDKDQAIKAGFDHHLVKPLDPSKLQRLLSEHVANPRKTH